MGIMALVAQAEREAISKRTKEALAVAKARGIRLGNPNGIEAIRRAGKGGAPLRAAIARNAERHARDLAPVVEDIRAGGAISLRAIAAELNDRGMLTRRGGRWHMSTVMNLLDRLGIQCLRRTLLLRTVRCPLHETPRLHHVEREGDGHEHRREDLIGEQRHRSKQRVELRGRQRTLGENHGFERRRRLRGLLRRHELAVGVDLQEIVIDIPTVRCSGSPPSASQFASARMP